MDTPVTQRITIVLVGVVLAACAIWSGQSALGQPKKLVPADKGGRIPEPKVGPSDHDCRSEFEVDKKNLASTGTNPYFILEVGYRLHFEHKKEKLTITVLPETKVVDGVETRVVEEREEVDGKLKEVSRNFFAIDKTTKDVYYFGEDVDNYKDGKIVNHSGGWLSGVGGAHFGLMMPGEIRVGDKFYNEHAPGKAMDRAEVVSKDEKVHTPAGRYEKCVHMKETTPLENDVSDKWYAPGVGLIKDDEMDLVRVEKSKG